MAWNPEPEVAAARDYGKKFNKDKVVIIAVNEKSGQFEIITYGETKVKCDYLKRVTGAQIEKLIMDGRITF